MDQQDIKFFHDDVETTFQVQQWDFYKSNLNDVNYFNTLPISE